ncbi:MAG: dTDP-4-dehydrorhamnose 3,5-epimerase [Terriglobales bacterium]
MSFAIESRPLEDIAVIVPHVHRDDRGFFAEVYRDDQFAAIGLPVKFVQDNHSFSRKGVVRGLHFQWEPPMGKLMRVTRGTAFLVAVDLRKGSPTLGRWFGLEASADNMKEVWAPAGFARGFCALTDDLEVQYKCTGTYNGKAESAIRWDDPDVGIAWPLQDVRLSEKDRNAQTLKAWLASPESKYFCYEPEVALSR